MRMLHYFKSFVLLVIITGGIISCTPQKKEKLLGLQLYSVRTDMKEDPAGTLYKVGQMGYKYIEPAGYADGKLYGMDPLEFNNIAQSNGLNFLSSHAGRPIPDTVDWDEAMKWWDVCIAAHKSAGAKYIVAPSMGKTAYESLAELKRYCDYFNQIGEKCNKEGIRFGYHNHSREFKELEGSVIYDYMLQNTDPDKVMFEMDLYWVVEGGADPLTYFEKYPGRFELWHVKDEAELGASGKMNFEAIFNNAEKSGVKYYIVEVEKYNFTPIESVQKSLEFLLEAEYVK